MTSLNTEAGLEYDKISHSSMAVLALALLDQQVAAKRTLCTKTPVPNGGLRRCLSTCALLYDTAILASSLSFKVYARKIRLAINDTSSIKIANWTKC
jgi:hypothetical protein